MGSLFDTGIRPAVDDYLQKQREDLRDYGDYWSASSAGYCMRKNIFERLGVPPTKEDPRKQRVFSSGHIFHEWIQGITKEAGLSIAQELELQDEELMIRGHIDDLVLIKGYNLYDYSIDKFTAPLQGRTADPEDHATSHLILYDYKTAHSKSFTYSKGRPMSFYHRLQLATYMYMLRKGAVSKQEIDAIGMVEAGVENLSEGRILTISKDDLRMDEKQLMWSEELSSEVRDYWTQLNNWWNEKKLPPCTCDQHENGFMAKEKWNPYFWEGEPCSVNYYNKWKEENK